MVEKEARKGQQAAAYKSQQREIAHLQRFVDRFGAKASLASRAKSKEKQIARLEAVAVEEPAGRAQAHPLQVPEAASLGAEGRRAGGGRGRPTATTWSTGTSTSTAERGQRIVLVGPERGRQIHAAEDPRGRRPDPGRDSRARQQRRHGLLRAEPPRQPPRRRDGLRERDGAAHEREPAHRAAGPRDPRGVPLPQGRRLQEGLRALRRARSPASRSPRLLVKPPNLLLMDEPTTHLDIAVDRRPGRRAAGNTTGTFIFISHDVYFIRALAKTVLHVHAGRLTPYAGDYDYYLEKSRATSERRGARRRASRTARPPQTGDSPAGRVRPEAGRAAAPAEAKTKRQAGRARRLRAEGGPPRGGGRQARGQAERARRRAGGARDLHRARQGPAAQPRARARPSTAAAPRPRSGRRRPASSTSLERSPRGSRVGVTPMISPTRSGAAAGASPTAMASQRIPAASAGAFRRSRG